MAAINATIPVVIFRDGNHFVAHCPVLDLSTSGRSLEEAQNRFEEAFKMFLSDLIEQGTLEEVLTSYGWHVARTPTPHWVPPHVVAHVEHEASIPVTA